MTKKQLLHRINILEMGNSSLQGTIKNREDRLVEHSNEIGRMLKVIDDVEAANRDLHVKHNLLQNKINMLTSALKSVTSTL